VCKNRKLISIGYNWSNIIFITEGRLMLASGMSKTTANQSGQPAAQSQVQNDSFFTKNKMFVLRIGTDDDIKYIKSKMQTPSGWKWVWPNFITNGGTVLLKRRNQMPDVQIGDLVIVDGKTLRHITKSDDLYLNILKHVNNVGAAAREELVTLGGRSTSVSLYGAAHSMPDSYARIAGAYGRFFCRRESGILEQGFKVLYPNGLSGIILQGNVKRIFTIKGQTSEEIYTNFYNVDLTTLEADLDAAKIKNLNEALGTHLTLQAGDTIQKSIKLKYIMKLLQEYDAQEKIPMLISIYLGGEVVKILIDFYSSYPMKTQVIVSVNTDDKYNTFEAHPYTDLIRKKGEHSAKDRFTASDANRMLESTLAELSTTDYNSPKYLSEFLFCVLIAESYTHRTRLDLSRTAGIDKLARGIIRNYSQTNTSLVNAFDIEKSEKNLFPTVGDRGATAGVRAVNKLVADCNRTQNVGDLFSDDSDCDEISGPLF
jgi:hypothetical protein